jgi:hypothetical protein
MHWKRLGCEQPSICSGLAHRTVSGAPGWPTVYRLLSGKRQRRTTIIHRTVRWCTGLSGEPTVASTNGRPCNLRVTHRLLQQSAGASDFPVCTGQYPVRQRSRRSNGRMHLIWKAIAHRTVTVTVRWCTGLSGAPLDIRQEMPSKMIFNGS